MLSQFDVRMREQQQPLPPQAHDPEQRGHAGVVRAPPQGAAAPSVRTLPKGVVGELRGLGCYALLHALAQYSHGAPAEMAHEMAWRLGDWDGSADGRQRSGCHGALAYGVRHLGTADDGIFATMKHAVGYAQQRLVLLARATPPEATTRLSAALSGLQLCAMLREASGALRADLPTGGGGGGGGEGDDWLLSLATVRRACMFGAAEAASAECGADGEASQAAAAGAAAAAAPARPSGAGG